MLGLFNRQSQTTTKPTDTTPTETTPAEKNPQDKRPAVVQPFGNMSTLLVGGGLAVAALAVSGIGNWTKDIGGWFQENLAVTQSAPKVDVRSLTINKIRGASELTTLVFSTEAIIPTSRDLQLGQFVVGSTRLLYIAQGEVRAGVDLSAVKSEDVVWDGNTLTVTLPTPKILDSKIDVSRSRVYDYNRGFLGLGPDVAPQLMTLAQQTALETVIQSACDRGLMAQAGERAKTVVGQLLGGSLTDATVEGAAPVQPTINIVVPEVDQATCAGPKTSPAPQTSGIKPAAPATEGAIAPATPIDSAPPAATPSPSAPQAAPPAADAPLPVPAIP